MGAFVGAGVGGFEGAGVGCYCTKSGSFESTSSLFLVGQVIGSWMIHERGSKEGGSRGSEDLCWVGRRISYDDDSRDDDEAWLAKFSAISNQAYQI